jgi:hypothetical protein
MEEDDHYGDYKNTFEKSSETVDPSVIYRRLYWPANFSFMILDIIRQAFITKIQT